MSFIIFVLQVLFLLALVFALLLLSVALAVALVQLGLFVGSIWNAVSSRSTWRLVFRVLLPLGFLMLVAAFLLLLLGVREESTTLYNTIGYVFGGIGGVVTITGWLGRFFTGPPLGQHQFEQAMAAQTERFEQVVVQAMAVQSEVVRSNNVELIVALSDLTQQLSALLAAQSEVADVSVISGDAED